MAITNELDIDNLVQAFAAYNFVPPSIVGNFGVFRNNRLVSIRGHNWFRSRSAAVNSLNRFISENIRRANIGTYGNPTPVTAYQVFNLTVQLYEEVPPSEGYFYNLRNSNPELYDRIFNLFEIRQIAQEDVAHLAIPVGQSNG